MHTLAIARKEWREMTRDRRSLYSGLSYGIWGPMVMGIALLAMARHQGELGAITIGAHGADQAPSLAAYLASRDVTLVNVDDAPDVVRGGELPAVLVIDERYATRYGHSRTAEVTLLFNSTRPDSSRYAAHLRSILTGYSRQVADTRLVIRGVAPSAVTPLRVLEQDFASAGERAGRAFATMPIFPGRWMEEQRLERAAFTFAGRDVGRHAHAADEGSKPGSLSLGE